ncbi:CPBP family intramembrane glutamic endopeptidase [Bacillus taeanensis]|uniref:CPBP family intramembrane metalloprotease n=1 Tax=Bacillus taeanensis TaxID=273032 RepID=A0A366XZT1_9BACI|nr:CPBP family intramembrane glutamic endopeptidase [Bacillus taeanensis]RBW70635.1 CPBP family intramembrane metalloprotease [Bacillus taeanensis]
MIIVNLIAAHLLIGFSFFISSEYFWIIFSISLFLLSMIAFRSRLIYWTKLKKTHLWISLCSAVMLYFIFFTGKALTALLFPDFLDTLSLLYATIQPYQNWHFFSLFLLIIPGEEFFWRGYLQTKLYERFSPITSIILSTMLYASAHLYSGSILLVLAAITGGIVWGWLYYYTKNLTISILSHLFFDFLLFIAFPLL